MKNGHIKKHVLKKAFARQHSKAEKDKALEEALHYENSCPSLYCWHCNFGDAPCFCGDAHDYEFYKMVNDEREMFDILKAEQAFDEHDWEEEGYDYPDDISEDDMEMNRLVRAEARANYSQNSSNDDDLPF